jgi:DNA-binding NarL/FixJ family response regulator/tetratricopeptide (TPR) repeat protein/nucleoside-triphosphatase THEP1
LATRVTSTRLIGRTVELAELEVAFAAAADGRPSIAFVAGESGVGKTRLVSELSARAKEEGARTLCGECVELGEGELPYAPLVAALRPLSRDGDPVLDEVGDAARAELATLLPELGARAAAPRPDEGAGTAQRRLFEALLALLERLGREDPVLLLLEDIHWADSSTRAFLAFIARAMSTERVLVVCTYRSDELHRRHPLRPLLAELERDPSARRIELARLNRDELSEHIADILDAPPDGDLMERLYGRSEGNPLFAEELLAAGDDGRGALPPTLRDALMVRAERLPEAAQEVLRVLAVAQRADHTLLADASGLGTAELRTALREATASHMIVVGNDGRYRFRHALLREVIHDDLLPGEHAELHLALARALERRAAAGAEDVWVTAGMAHHFRSAGDQPAALKASVQAAAASARVHAHGEAAGLLERALEIWDRVPDAEALAGASHADILVRAAAAHRSNVDDHRRAELLRLAVAELEREGDPHRLADVLGELASAQWSLGRGEESRATLRRALDLLPDGDRSPERAQLLSRRVAFLMLQGRYGEVRDGAQAALDAARAVGAEDICPPILNRLGVALYALGEPEEGEVAFEEAVRFARATGQSIDEAFIAANRGDALHRAGRSREGLAAVIAAEAGVPDGSRARRWLAMQRAEIEFSLGEWDAAEAHLPHRGRLTGTTLAYFNLTRAGLLLGRGDLRAARPLLEETARILVLSLEPQYLAGCGALRGELERREGDLEAARAIVEDAIDRIEFCSEDGERLAEVACVGVRVEADAAERARDLGDAEAEHGARLRAEMMQARVQAAADDLDLPVPTAHAASAAADVARAAGATDPALYAAAADAWAAIERPYPVAMSRFAEAEAHLRAGDRDATIAAARAAQAAARALGARWLAGEVDGLAARARLRLAEAAPAAADGAPDEEAAFGLTPRELQVLALLAGGATNREIGAQLFMAEKTASVHVSRILSKLDVRSRTEAAAVAHRHGLEAAPR